MSKLVFFVVQGHGHVNATLPLASELAARGEDVVYYSVDKFADRIRRAGVEYRSYPRSFYRNEGSTTFNALWLYMQGTSDLLEAELERVREDAPPILILDSLSYPGRWIAEALDVPVLLLSTTFVPNAHVLSLLQPGDHVVEKPRPMEMMQKMVHWQEAMELKRRMQRKFGLEGPPKMAWFEGAEVNLVYTSRYLHPAADTFDSTVRFIGRSLPDAEASPTFEAPGGSGPFVYVSMGTVFNNDKSLFRTCYEALEGCRVLITTGGGVREEDFESVPAWVQVKDFLPLESALAANREADVFVTHGGMGSVTESMHYGVPVVVVPQLFEQAVIGRRLEQLGAGICLNAGQFSKAALRDAVRRVSGDDSYRRACTRIGDSLRNAGGLEEAVNCVLDMKNRA